MYSIMSKSIFKVLKNNIKNPFGCLFMLCIYIYSYTYLNTSGSVQASRSHISNYLTYEDLVGLIKALNGNCVHMVCLRQTLCTFNLVDAGVCKRNAEFIRGKIQTFSHGWRKVIFTIAQFILSIK